MITLQGSKGIYKVLINNVALSREAITHDTTQDDSIPGNLTLDLWKREDVDLLCSQTLEDIPTKLGKIGIKSKIVPGINTYFRTDIFPLKDIISFSFSQDIDPGEWKSSWTIKDYMDELGDIVLKHYTTCRFLPDYRQFSFAIEFDIPRDSRTISDFVADFLIEFEKLHMTTLLNLSNSIQAGTFITFFNFPEPVRVACEQYLLYFTEFLKDVGIEAISDLQHEAGKVLFSVTPAEGEQALDQIREALSLYLKLPAQQNQGALLYTADIEVQRLAANVQHLQGQLMLAVATMRQQEEMIKAKEERLEAKDTMIQAQHERIQTQRLLLDQQRWLTSGQVLIDSVTEIKPAPSDDKPEELAGGLVELNKYELGPITFDLPELFRMLRRKFGKSE